MDETICSSFLVKEILCDDGVLKLKDAERQVIGEISLKIYINSIKYASLLCLNQMTEELALGFLFSEGVIDSREDIASIVYDERLFTVMINLAAGRSVEKCESLRSVTSGGGKCFTYIKPLQHDQFQPAPAGEKHALKNVLSAMARFEQQSEIFKTVGGVHSALFQHEEISVFNEDIGRHNCFDKIAGVLLKNNKMSLMNQGIMFVSGRVSSEIITKVIRMGVGLLVSRSTPTSAAVRLAREYNVTLLGYVRNNAGYVYSGENRLF